MTFSGSWTLTLYGHNFEHDDRNEDVYCFIL